MRTALLEDLATGLGPADEPFLEAALDDRAMGVRAAAARLLARITGSALSRRMAGRADAMLAWEAPKGIGGFLKSALGRKGGLAVNPPQAIDASWTRDGIGGKPPQWLGERAHWLSEVLACVDPAHWERLAPPADFALALWRTDWGLALLLGLARAVRLHRAGAWAGPLLDAVAATPKGTPEFPVTETIRDLVHAMPPADLEPRVVRALGGDDPLGLARMLAFLPVPWPAQVGRRYLEGVRGQVKASAGDLLDQLAVAARALPPGLLADVPQLEPAADAPPHVRGRVEAFRNIVRLRRRIHEEIVP